MTEFRINSVIIRICLSIGLSLVVAAPVSSYAAKSHKTSSCASALDGISTVSMYADLESEDSPEVLKQIGEIYRNRRPRLQEMIDQWLTQAHAGREMTFQVKNPKTGNYDKFNNVPVNGQILPLMKSDYDRLVQSTGPVLRALRALMQRAYSVNELTIQSMGLQALPVKEAEIVIKVIEESIYFERKMRGPQMAEYPFLPFSGVDGAIVDPKNPQPLFFELNLATPSGMSNNRQLVEDLKHADPEIYRAIAPYLAEDHSFEMLREVMEESGKAWTGMTGIAVVLSPGSYNGAHPDVASIARQAGLPVVNVNDLYQDKDGLIRLNTGEKHRHPVVNTIFNRREESFVLNSTKLGIPLISPRYTHLEDLGRKLGLNLQSGVIYKFKTDAEGNPIDIERGPNGEPLLEESWDTLGEDPHRPGVPPGSLASAILNRKLYLSNLGGGVASDKRLFRIVSEYLAQPENGAPVAHPIRGLTPYNLDVFYANPAGFVVKEPNNSGGSGVVFMNTLTAEAQQAIVERVKKAPFEFEIQYLSNLVTLPQASAQSMNTHDAIFDDRIYVMMGPDGKVMAGPNSQLVRIAPKGSFYSNTSQGGGYGIGVVLNSSRSRVRQAQGARPALEPVVAAASQREMLTYLLLELRDLYENLADSELNVAELGEQRELAKTIVYRLRELLPVLSTEDAETISKFREFSQLDDDKLNWDAAVAIKATALKVLRRVFRGRSFNQEIFEREVGQFIQAHPEIVALFSDADFAFGSANWTEPNPYGELTKHFKFKKLDQPVISGEITKPGQVVRREKVEIAEYIASDYPEIQEIIDYVRANGGAIHLMKSRMVHVNSGKFSSWHWEPPFFWADIYSDLPTRMVPRIAIDLSQDRALAALYHELQHFKIFIGFRDSYIAEGMSREDATVKAVSAVLTRDMVVFGERQAIEAEMKAECDFKDHPCNVSKGMIRASQFWDPAYVNRVTYPEFSAIRNILFDAKVRSEEPDAAEIKKYMAEMVRRALTEKKKSLEFLTSEEVASGGLKDHRGREVLDPGQYLSFWKTETIYTLLTYPYGLERIGADGTIDQFKWHLAQACKEAGVSEKDCGVKERRLRRAPRR